MLDYLLTPQSGYEMMVTRSLRSELDPVIETKHVITLFDGVILDFSCHRHQVNFESVPPAFEKGLDVFSTLLIFCFMELYSQTKLQIIM